MKKKVKKSIKKPPKKFDNLIYDIKSLKVQGAENVCKVAIEAYLLNPTRSGAKKILATRSTEPLMQNAIKELQKSKNPKQTAKKFLNNLKKSHEKIVKAGAKLIKKDMNIYVHCHSSTVMDILKYAKEIHKKHFVVYTTEVEPKLQGHLTAEDLAKFKIKVIVLPDLAAEQALRKCHLFLFGADAYSKTEVANKIGTKTLTNLAKYYKIPRYTCLVSRKFTKKIKIEMRLPKEVWDERNENIQVLNPAFDKTKLKNLTGIISEFGILKPKQFVKKFMQNQNENSSIGRSSRRPSKKS